jgi:prepilin-type processing-associated H-X9-DG protein
MAQMMPFFEQQNAYNQAYTWATNTTANGGANYWPWGNFPSTPANPALGIIQKTLFCPADARESMTMPGSQAGLYPSSNVAFTGYLAVGGLSADNSDISNTSQLGILYWTSTTRMTDITDGTSNTMMVGERPPSADLQYGWWFAGAGWDGSGVGDVILGVREYNYAASLGCSSSYVNFQAGKISNTCDQAHFWSMHTGGANFVYGDASVRFVNYSANSVFPQLATRSGGEVVPNY